MHFIYVIGPAAHADGPNKIGISADPERRCRQLQTGHADRLTVHYREPIEEGRERARLFERLLHRDIAHHRCTGEWFALSVEQAIGAVQMTLIDYDAVPDLAERVRRRRI